MATETVKAAVLHGPRDLRIVSSSYTSPHDSREEEEEEETNRGSPAQEERQIAAPGADAMGRAGLDGDVQTFFWDRAGAVALFALMDTAIGAGQAAGTAALSRAVTGGNGSVLNFGSIGNQAQGLASQEMASRINRPPVVTRDQAMPMTVTVGQDLDFTDACKQAMRVDPMACPLL